MSGSKPREKDMKATLIVSKVIIKPKAMVAKTTAKMDGNSVKVIPQNREPKIKETQLIATLVAKVITIRA
jgi:hypothetical protein